MGPVELKAFRDIVDHIKELLADHTAASAISHDDGSPSSWMTAAAPILKTDSKGTAPDDNIKSPFDPQMSAAIVEGDTTFHDSVRKCLEGWFSTSNNNLIKLVQSLSPLVHSHNTDNASLGEIPSSSSSLSTSRWLILLADLIDSILQRKDCTDRFRRQCFRLLQKIIADYDALPSSLFLSNVVIGEGIAGGGYGDVYQSEWEGNKVCVKVLRPHVERDKFHKRFAKEVAMWRHLKHPYILPLIGVYLDLSLKMYGLVSPWLSNGNVRQFLLRHPNHPRLQCILEIALGIEYLHSSRPQIVHGDIKGANVLMTDDGHCCLADFGLAHLQETNTATPSSNVGFSLRWTAPEILHPARYNRLLSYARDLYAFACCIYEIYTEKNPHFEMAETAILLAVVVQHKRPSRQKCIPEPIWCLMEKLWHDNPEERIKSNQAVACLRRISEGFYDLPSTTTETDATTSTADEHKRQSLTGISFGFGEPIIQEKGLQYGNSMFAIPEHIELETTKCFYLAGPSWDQLLAVMRSHSETTLDRHGDRIEHDEDCFTILPEDKPLRVRFSSYRSKGSEKWIIVLWLSANYSPVEFAAWHQPKLIKNPTSEQFNLRSELHCDISKTVELPFFSLPMSFREVAAYLELALEHSRTLWEDEGISFGEARAIRRLAECVQYTSGKDLLDMDSFYARRV